MSAPTPDTEVAIVTGGLRGLGRAMTLGLLQTGRKVVAVGHLAEDDQRARAAHRRSA